MRTCVSGGCVTAVWTCPDQTLVIGSRTRSIKGRNLVQVKACSPAAVLCCLTRATNPNRLGVNFLSLFLLLIGSLRAESIPSGNNSLASNTVQLGFRHGVALLSPHHLIINNQYNKKTPQYNHINSSIDAATADAHACLHTSVTMSRWTQTIAPVG